MACGLYFSVYTCSFILSVVSVLGHPLRGLECSFLFAFHSNYDRIFNRLLDIQRQNKAWPWKLGHGMFKVIENDAIW